MHGFTLEMHATSGAERVETTVWHAQSSLMLNGRHVPLYAVLTHPVFLYIAFSAVARTQLRPLVEALAVAIGLSSISFLPSLFSSFSVSLSLPFSLYPSLSLPLSPPLSFFLSLSFSLSRCLSLPFVVSAWCVAIDRFSSSSI